MVDVDELSRFLNAVNDRLLVFQFTRFGGNEAQYDLLLIFQILKRCEVTCTVGVEFEIVAVDVVDAEQGFGYRLIAARRCPGGMVVTTAYVGRYDQIGWKILHRFLIHAGKQLFGIFHILTRMLSSFPIVFITEHTPCAIIQLQAAAALTVQRLNHGLVGFGDIRHQFIQIAVIRIGCFFILSAQQLGQELCRCRDRLARDRILTCGLLQEFEIFNERMTGMSDFTGQACGFRSCFHTLELVAVRKLYLFHTIQTPHKIKMPPGASEFTVCHGLKSYGFLLFH
ncbi:hypothetical protein D3C74_274450 [compost metagenome]